MVIRWLKRALADTLTTYDLVAHMVICNHFHCVLLKVRTEEWRDQEQVGWWEYDRCARQDAIKLDDLARMMPQQPLHEQWGRARCMHMEDARGWWVASGAIRFSCELA